MIPSRSSSHAARTQLGDQSEEAWSQANSSPICQDHKCRSSADKKKSSSLNIMPLPLHGSKRVILPGCMCRCATEGEAGLPSATFSCKPTSNLFPFFIENSPSCKLNYCAVNVKWFSFNASTKKSKSSTVQTCSHPVTSTHKQRELAAPSVLLSVGGLHLSC